jgi:hypothetical protein
MSKFYKNFEYVKKGPSETKKTFIVDPKEGVKTISDYAKDKDFPAKVIRTLNSKGGSTSKYHTTKEGKKAKKGLWYNIAMKKKRGEKMRKKGAKGAPTEAAIKKEKISKGAPTEAAIKKSQA